MTGVLVGRHVWLSRPAGRAAPWQTVLEAAGATVHLAPLIMTAPLAATPELQAALERAACADIVIVTSAAAVDALGEIAPGWAPRGRLVAVGQATARALVRATGQTVATPATSDSEGLLAMPELAAISQAHIVILAGEGGRTLLAEDLAPRAASLERLSLYRRAPVMLDNTQRAYLLARCDSLVLTSEASWQALIGQCDATARERLAGLYLVAPSLRVVQITRRDIDWQHPPTLIEPMDAQGVREALVRAAVS